MKLLNNTLMLATALLALSACQETEDNTQHYNNHLFITGESFTHDVLFPSEDPEQGADITVAIAKPEPAEVKATLSPAPEMVDTYKLVYFNDNVEQLPAACYSMPQTEAVINPGSIESTPLHITFTNTEELDFNTVYVLPVTIKAVSGAPLLESAKTCYYVFKGASLINVVCNISKTRAYPDFNNDAQYNNLSENTLEILFKAASFPNTLNTLMGIEGRYLLRLGDAGVPANQLQVATSAGNLTSTDLQFETGKWYHLAVTFNAGDIKVYVNGAEKMSAHLNLSTVSLGTKHSNEDDGSRCFWIGYSYSKDRYLDGLISEVRVWNRALTPADLAQTSHFYKVDPDSDGLLSYWRFCEGSGSTVRDYAKGGHDVTIDAPKWEAVALPER